MGSHTNANCIKLVNTKTYARTQTFDYNICILYLFIFFIVLKHDFLALTTQAQWLAVC